MAQASSCFVEEMEKGRTKDAAFCFCETEALVSGAE
jgi:hypothetical protein